MSASPPLAIDILITNGTVLTMNDAAQVIPNGAVAVADSRIVAVGDTRELQAQYRPRETLDASGMLVMPGLINTHTHSGDALFRGMVEDLSLEDWLQKLWVVESRFLSPETVRWGARLAYIEMVRSGITTAVDMFWFPETLAEAARAVGIRLVTGMVYFDASTTDGIEFERRNTLARDFTAQYKGDELIVPSIQPHGVYTVSPDHLRQVGALAQELGVLLTTHASETRTEVRNCIRNYGLTPIKHLDRLGLLTPHTLLAHCVHLEEDEFDLLAQRGTTVAHCPASNLKLASGIAEVTKMQRAGVQVTLGTDGPVSGNDLNFWYTLRLAATLQKTVNRDPALMPTSQIVHMATRDAARALGLDDQIGSLEVGKLADVILLHIGRAHTTPAFDPYALLVYNLGREDVDTVLIHGRMVMRAGVVTRLDENEVLKAVRGLEQQLQAFIQDE